MSGDRYYISDQQGVYFLTFTVVGWLDVFIRPTYKSIIVDSLNYCIAEKGLEVYAWCLMTSLYTLLLVQKKELSYLLLFESLRNTQPKIIKEIDTNEGSRKAWLLWYFEQEGKKDSCITKYKFWKEDNHALFLDKTNIEMIDPKVDYIHLNPVV